MVAVSIAGSAPANRAKWGLVVAIDWTAHPSFSPQAARLPSKAISSTTRLFSLFNTSQKTWPGKTCTSPRSSTPPIPEAACTMRPSGDS